MEIELGNSDLYHFLVKNLFLEFLDFAQYVLYNGRKIISTRLNINSGSVKIAKGVNLAKKDTNFGETDVCDINCINFSKVDDPMILSCFEDHCAMCFPHAKFQEN